MNQSTVDVAGLLGLLAKLGFVERSTGGNCTALDLLHTSGKYYRVQLLDGLLVPTELPSVDAPWHVCEYQWAGDTCSEPSWERMPTDLKGLWLALLRAFPTSDLSEVFQTVEVPCCPDCGSEAINVDAVCCVFDVRICDWVAEAIGDEFHCTDCDSNFSEPVLFVRLAEVSEEEDRPELMTGEELPFGLMLGLLPDASEDVSNA